MPKVRSLTYSFLVVCISLYGSAVNAQEGQLQLDVQSLSSGLSRLETAIRETVRVSGGDLESQGINLVLAFKTGYFKDDPVRASAARATASALVQNLLVTGDRFTVHAYEFGLWDFNAANSVTAQVTLSSRNDLLKTTQFAALLPNTPKAGSQGGHDTERAITELGAMYRDASDAVIVMISNVAASQGAPGERLLGSNAPDYLETLKHFTRMAGLPSGATLEIPFKVNIPNSTPTEARLEIVILLPKTFTGAKLFGGTRSELLNGSAASSAVVPATSVGFPWPVVLILVVALAVTAIVFMRGRTGSGALSLEINGQAFSLAGVPNGRSIVTLVGRSYSGQEDGPTLELDKAPDARIARISRDASGVKVETLSSDLVLTTIDGLPADEPARIKYQPSAGNRALIFSGNVPSSTGAKLRVNITVTLGLVREG